MRGTLLAVRSSSIRLNEGIPLLTKIGLSLVFGAAVSSPLYATRLDEEPPKIVVNIPNGSLWVKSVTPIIEVVDDNDSNPKVSVFLNGTPWRGNTDITVSGGYRLEIIAEDSSGNRSEKQISFSVIDKPHYRGTFEILRWLWWQDGEYLGLDAIITIQGNLKIDERISNSRDYPQVASAFAVPPYAFSLGVVDEAGKPLKLHRVAPAGYKADSRSGCGDKSNDTPQDEDEKRNDTGIQTLLSAEDLQDSVMCILSENKVLVRFLVLPKEKLLKAGIPARVKVYGRGVAQDGGFTFEAEIPILGLVENTHEIKRMSSLATPCDPPRDDNQCCVWVKYPETKKEEDTEQDNNRRGCASNIAGSIHEEYKILATPLSIFGNGFVWDVCPAQEAVVPTPPERGGGSGVATSGFYADPALELERKPHCQCKCWYVSVNGTVKYEAFVKKQGDAYSAIAGYMVVDNNIKPFQALGGVAVSAEQTQTVEISIGGVKVGLITFAQEIANQLFAGSAATEAKTDHANVVANTGVWITMRANGHPFPAQAIANLKAKEFRVKFRGKCRDCGAKGEWERGG